LDRAVKDIPNSERRIELLRQAINSKSLVVLYDQRVGKNGENEFVSNGYFTTKEVRQEEERILRIAGKISSQSNYTNNKKMSSDINDYEGVSDVQREGLRYLLLNKGGLQILRGRAGTGKSHLLGALNKLATNRGRNVIGLAPTHKAKIELKDKGYANTNTIKGFLYDIKNGKARLARHSTLVVDEAGMVSNRDLQELLKLAHAHKSNIILAGDERQLTSVERGGLFEILVNRCGSFELSDIRRQSAKWGREMASCFASNHISKGIDILVENNGIVISSDEYSSMADLIMDWSKSKYEIPNRLIVTVRNHDANRINNGIREVLKVSGVLSGKEYMVESQEIIGNDLVVVQRKFMTGDRILFTSSDKDLGISNGEFGTIVSAGGKKFIARLDGDKKTEKEVSFNPGEIGFKHGYAVTTYKSQGASILEVYPFHNGAGNCRSTYVGLTRHIESVRLYCNRKVVLSKVCQN
jgi:ATP-dependent exoDNAse (exonuclease V) alpha subunit